MHKKAALSLIRVCLDRLFAGCAFIAALMMAATLLAVLAGMIDRKLSLGLQGTDMYAGYFMAAAGFLSLAYTLKKNEHIRVNLLLNKTPFRLRWALEWWCLGLAVLLSGLFAWYSVHLAWDSYIFKDISTGNDATPLWIPQTSMALGSWVFFIAFVDEWILHMRGKRSLTDSKELARTE